MAARKDVLSWDDYFMAVAFLSAQRSKDPVRQVGACIVNSDRKIVGIGYNGMPRVVGHDNDEVLPWADTADDVLNTKHPYVCHAELNAVLNKNSADVKGCRLFVVEFPCNECAKVIVQGGIRQVVYAKVRDEDDRAARRIFLLAGVGCTQYKPKTKQIVIDFKL